MRQAHLIVVAALVLATSGWSAPDARQEMPPTEAVLARLWANMDLMAFQLSGKVRTKDNVYAISLNTKGREMIYRFLDSPLHIRVVFAPGESKVYERRTEDQKWKPVSLVRQREAVLNSDITFEELGLNFFNWPRIEPAGIDSVKTMKAYCFDAYPEGTPTKYFKVRFWISAQHFVMLRADAYDEDERVIKRVEINGVLKIDEAYTVKELQISTFSPGSSVSKSRTYIEINSGKVDRAALTTPAEVEGETPEFRADAALAPRYNSGPAVDWNETDVIAERGKTNGLAPVATTKESGEGAGEAPSNRDSDDDEPKKPTFRSAGRPTVRAP